MKERQARAVDAMVVFVVGEGDGVGGGRGGIEAGRDFFGGGEAGPDAGVAGDEATEAVYGFGAGKEVEAGAAFLIPVGWIIGAGEVGEGGVSVGERIVPERAGEGVVVEGFGVDDADDGAAAEDDEFQGVDGEGAVRGREVEKVNNLYARPVDVDGAQFSAGGQAGGAGGEDGIGALIGGEIGGEPEGAAGPGFDGFDGDGPEKGNRKI